MSLRDLFYQLTPIKSKRVASSQHFEKLMKKKVVTKSGLIQKVDLSLCFQSYNGVGGSKFVDFIGFCGLMQKFYKEKMVH